MDIINGKLLLITLENVNNVDLNNTTIYLVHDGDIHNHFIEKYKFKGFTEKSSICCRVEYKGYNYKCHSIHLMKSII